MIGYLSGKIISKKPTKIILDVNGVGYMINISVNTFEKIADKEVVSLFTFLSVKQDSLDLYGFYTYEEKEMFELLIGVSGIGPRTAQSILSGIQLDDLREAIKQGNVNRLVSAPGIGRKTAERMIVELREKIDSVGEITEGKYLSSTSIKNDAVAALVNLGYNQKVAERTVITILNKKPKISIEDLVREALAHLNN